jgi:agmatinase
MLDVYDSSMGLDIAVIGVPYDGGTTGKSGAKDGPAAIRSASYLSGYLYTFDGVPIDLHRVGDLGDIELTSGGSSHDMVQEVYEQLLVHLQNRSLVPIMLGGDHTITFGAVSALASIHGPLSVVHLDAHSDTWDEDGILNHASVFRRLIEGGYISKLHQFGVRGFNTPDNVEWLDDMSAIIDSELPKGEAIYLSVDIDVVDPAYAPGTGTPEPGGATSLQILENVAMIAKDCNIIGADVVEVAPSLDPTGITALLASRIVCAMIGGIQQPREQQ